jgi:pyroglutamyl-peptidase
MIDGAEGSQRSGRAPMRRLLEVARGTRVVTRLSRDAGRYVCNYAYWRALAAADRPHGPRIVVFIHVPAVRPRHARPTGARRRYSLEDVVRVGEAIVMAAAAAIRAPR